MVFFSSRVGRQEKTFQWYHSVPKLFIAFLSTSPAPVSAQFQGSIHWKFNKLIVTSLQDYKGFVKVKKLLIDFNGQLMVIGYENQLQRKNEIKPTLAMASKQWPPDTSITMNGKSRLLSAILGVSACASMWWMGITSFQCFRLRYCANWLPVLEDEAESERSKYDNLTQFWPLKRLLDSVSI